MTQQPKTLATLSPGQRISAARGAAAKAMPYFESGIRSLVPKERPGIGTFVVTDKAVMYWDPEVMSGWTADEAGGVVLHEWMHIFLKHPDRARRLMRVGAISSRLDMQRFNHACDMEINDNLVEAGIKLPKIPVKDSEGNTTLCDPIFPSTYGMEDGKTAEEYYVLLREKDPDGSRMQGGPGWGSCGSGAGNAQPDIEPPGDDDPDSRSEADMDMENKAAAESIQRQASKGNVPAGLVRAAGTYLTPPKVRWGEKLGVSVRGAVAQARGASDYTFARRSRRQNAMDMTMRPAPVLPGTVSKRIRVWFGVDTSGSMGDEDQRRAVSEAEGIMKSTGAELTVIACDAAIQGFKKVQRAAEIFAELKGGGGTDFRPMFRKLEEERARPDVFVIYTDGYGEYPSNPPDGVKVIWLNIGQISCGWGEVIDVDFEKEE